MRRTGVIVVVSLLAAVAHAAPAVLNFDGDAVDAPPLGMTFGRTGPGRAGRWVVQAARDAPSGGKVLAELDSDDTDGRFALAVADAPVAADLTLSVTCKPIAGKVDRACGRQRRRARARGEGGARQDAARRMTRCLAVLAQDP